MKKALAVLLAALMMVSAVCCGETGVRTVILKEQDECMRNTYTLIAVDPDAPFADAEGRAVADVYVNTCGADALIQFLLSAEGLALADGYGMKQYGAQLFYSLDDAPVYEGEIAHAEDETRLIRLSTTTSVNDSGLLGEILPVFEEKYGYDVNVYSVGTGKAIASAEYGNADLILVHAQSQEEAFIERGFGRIAGGFDREPLSFIYNYFVLCGPVDDPAGATAAETVEDAFRAIAEGKHSFISRGDMSGTHTKELTLWPEEMGIGEDAQSFRDYAGWYVSANAGMGACLVMAEQMGGYILTDKGTYMSFANGGI